MGNLGLHVDSIVSHYGKPARGSTLPKVVSCVLFADILINRLNLGSTDRHIFQLLKVETIHSRGHHQGCCSLAGSHWTLKSMLSEANNFELWSVVSFEFYLTTNWRKLPLSEMRCWRLTIINVRSHIPFHHRIMIMVRCVIIFKKRRWSYLNCRSSCVYLLSRYTAISVFNHRIINNLLS